MMEMNRKWSGIYRGINFEISHHGVHEEYRPEGIWCYYIILNEQQIPREYYNDFVLKPRSEKRWAMYDYMDSPLAHLDWHGGITFYDKLGGIDGQPLLIKAGCDYGHYWDEDHMYNEHILEMDVKRFIDELWDRYPNLLVRSTYYGKYYPVAEGEFNEYDNFVAFREQEQWKIDHPDVKP